MVNKVILIGNLGKDPELRYTPNQKAVTSFPLATTERWKDQNGELQKKTEWHNIVVWGKQAEVVSNYLKKGRQAYVEGRIQTRPYDDKNGIKRFRTEVIAQQIRFLGRKGDEISEEPEELVESDIESPAQEEEEDLPF